MMSILALICCQTWFSCIWRWSKARGFKRFCCTTSPNSLNLLYSGFLAFMILLWDEAQTNQISSTSLLDEFHKVSCFGNPREQSKLWREINLAYWIHWRANLTTKLALSYLWETSSLYLQCLNTMALLFVSLKLLYPAGCHGCITTWGKLPGVHGYLCRC